MRLRVRVFESYAELPAAFGALFEDARSGDLFRSREWLHNGAQNGLRPGDRPRVFTVESEGDGAPIAVLPALYSRLYSAHPRARVLHFLQPEELPYAPLLAGQGERLAEALEAVVRFLRDKPATYDVIRVSPLGAESPFAAAMRAALRRGGHPLQTYFHPSARYESVAGQSFNDYLAGRPRALRDTLSRNTQLLLEGGRGDFALVRTPQQLNEAWSVVARLLAAAPVEGEEELPNYVPSLMAAAAEADCLRLGLFFLDARPVAMQLWVVTRGIAHCLRIWDAQGAGVFPIDEVLTQMMTLCLIDGDRVAELDFGAVSAPFAESWAPKARARLGLAAFNPRTWRGLRGAARHVGGQMLRSFPARLWRKIRGAGPAGRGAPPA